MLERLGSYPRANGLAPVLREIGRVKRTLFTLDWIESPEQRRRATREPNKGKAENALKRAIFFHRIGRIRDTGLPAQSHRASALNLVASAIVLWNTTYRQAVKPPSGIWTAPRAPFRTICSSTSRCSAGSKSTLAAITSGPTPRARPPSSGRCGRSEAGQFRRALSVYLCPFYVVTPSRQDFF